MTQARQAASTMATLRTRVRREINDPATMPDGTAIPAEARGTSDQEIDESINYALVEMGTEMTGKDPGSALAYADLSYSSGSYSTNLGSSIGENEIYDVWDVTDDAAHRRLSWCSIQEFSTWDVSNPLPLGAPQVWTLIADDTDLSSSSIVREICVRPNGNAMTLRVFYLKTPLTISGVTYASTGAMSTETGDVSPLRTQRWLQLCVLIAACNIMDRNDETPEKLEQHKKELWAQFVTYCRAHRGPARIRNARRAIA